MNRLCIATRGIGSWRERLACPDRQWRRRFSAFETAVSCELASRGKSGVPEPIASLFRQSQYGELLLMFAVAEHKVDLRGSGAASQSDLWAVVKTSSGMLSLTVEAKAKEPFGGDVLEQWLIAGVSQESKRNRKIRWDQVRAHLPKSDSFLQVRYQMLHRCASSVIEAKRLGFQHAAFVVQAFETPEESFQDYVIFCQALKIPAKRGGMSTTSSDGVSLSVGWADCPLAIDEQVAATA
jgi:hypothetical protein